MINIIISAILFILLSIFIGITIYDKKKIKEFQINQNKYLTHKQELEKKYYEDEKEFQDKIEQLKQKSLESYQQFEEHLNEKRRLQESLISNQKKLVDQEISSYKKLELQKATTQIEREINSRKIQQEASYQEFIDGLNEFYQQKTIEREKLDLELEELTKKRNATIEAYKREEERKLQQDYYRIQLSQQELDDMKLLIDIRPKLYNKDAINKLIYEVIIKKPLNELLYRIVGNSTFSGIYKITHIESQKCYIGKSTDVKKRLTEHVKGALNISSIADQEIHHQMEKLGLQNFTFEILEKVDKDKLGEREKYYINYYQSQNYGFNRASGG